jgi:hypothetical protein
MLDKSLFLFKKAFFRIFFIYRVFPYSYPCLCLSLKSKIRD